MRNAEQILLELNQHSAKIQRAPTTQFIGSAAIQRLEDPVVDKDFVTLLVYLAEIGRHYKAKWHPSTRSDTVGIRTAKQALRAFESIAENIFRLYHGEDMEIWRARPWLSRSMTSIEGIYECTKKILYLGAPLTYIGANLKRQILAPILSSVADLWYIIPKDAAVKRTPSAKLDVGWLESITTSSRPELIVSVRKPIAVPSNVASIYMASDHCMKIATKMEELGKVNGDLPQGVSGLLNGAHGEMFDPNKSLIL